MADAGEPPLAIL